MSIFRQYDGWQDDIRDLVENGSLYALAGVVDRLKKATRPITHEVKVVTVTHSRMTIQCDCGIEYESDGLRGYATAVDMYREHVLANAPRDEP